MGNYGYLYIIGLVIRIVWAMRPCHAMGSWDKAVVIGLWLSGPPGWYLPMLVIRPSDLRIPGCTLVVNIPIHTIHIIDASNYKQTTYREE